MTDHDHEPREQDSELDHQEIEKEHLEFMNTFAQEVTLMLNEIYGPGMGFFFAMFETGDTSRFNYIGNCNRDDIITLLDEISAKFKAARARTQ